MVLKAVAAPVDHGDADVDEFVQSAFERAPNAGVKAEEILEHVRAMRQRFLHIARFALELLLVDLLYFGRSLIGFDKRDSRHGVLELVGIGVRIIEHNSRGPLGGTCRCSQFAQPTPAMWRC